MKRVTTTGSNMQGRHRQRLSMVLSLAFAIGLVCGGGASADQSSSTHYKVSETQFGAGSALQDCSGNYCAKESAGDTAVGLTQSADYSAEAGFNTSDAPVLELIVVNGSDDMGVLGTDATGTALAGVKVRSYLSSGYVIQVTGEPPSQGDHALDVPTMPTDSQQGHEQFGLNLTANSAPDIGAAPIQVPSSSFSYGTVASDYGESNKFMYQNGDIVAKSATSTGETDYTMSFIANVTNVTPAGRYSGAYSAVVVPTY